jgi:hypothetical protein
MYQCDSLNNRLSAATFDGLPSPDTKRWVASRKADVVRAIREGILSRIDACTRYRLSDEELRLWERAIDAVGTPGLRVTRVQVYREIFEGCH